MKNILEKIVDYYLNKRLKDKIIFLFIITGIALVAQPLWKQLLEEWLKIEYNINIPDLKFYGIGFILSGLFILYLDIKYSLLPSLFNTQKTTKIIALGNNRYQFIFDKRMRCTPTVRFIQPTHKCNIKEWDSNGFIVEFEEGKPILKIDYWADAWDGLNYRQKLYILILNLFRRRKNKLTSFKYSSDFANRQIHKLNTL